MNHLGVSVSPKSITKTLECVGEDFEKHRTAWKSKVVSHLEKEIELTSQIERPNNERKDLQQKLGSHKVGNDNEELSKVLERVGKDCNDKEQELKSQRGQHPPAYCAVIDNYTGAIIV